MIPRTISTVEFSSVCCILFLHKESKVVLCMFFLVSYALQTRHLCLYVLNFKVYVFVSKL